MKWLIVATVVPLFAIRGAALAESLPLEISATVNAIKKEFEYGGGQFDLKNALDHGFLGRAHKEVWIFDYTKFRCINNLCWFGGCIGTGVMELDVFIRLRDGRVEKVFGDPTQGATLEHSGRSPKLLLKVLGEDCGQTGDFEPFEAIACVRPLVWNEKAQELDFAPLSEAKITWVPKK